jgi:hypothetical protein
VIEVLLTVLSCCGSRWLRAKGRADLLKDTAAKKQRIIDLE